MLPSGLDIQTMTWIMWGITILSLITMLLMIKSLDKPALRVVITIILLAVMTVCVQYTRDLGRCESKGDTCYFFSKEVPKDGGFIN